MASQKDISISLSKAGMNKEVHMSALQQGEYRHAKNSNLFNEGGSGLNIQNEHSNILASKFKDDYVVVGVKNDPFSESTYYFLKSTKDGSSEIGVIKNVSNVTDQEDIVLDCDDCNSVTELSTPLEYINQQESQVYVTLLNDGCIEAAQCLNFNIDFPIKSVEIKNEKCGKVMYFTDNFNSPRYIELDNLEKYSYIGEELCGDDSNVQSTCVACEKMEMFGRKQIPEITPTEIVLGGNLKRGTYEFLLAYSDEVGNEVSRYYSITNPISIFDRENNILEQRELADETNYAIKLTVSDLDLKYTHYKVAVIQRTDINSATSYFIEGVHSTSDNTIIYTSDRDKQRTVLSELNKAEVRVEKWKSLTSANGYLFGSGITYEKKMNLQPVVNLMGLFLNWQTSIANENLYKNGVAAANKKTYYRDEGYPFGIRFLLDGEYTPTYPFISRPARSEELEVVVGNKDIQSANKLNDSCSTTPINKKYQIYNTAKELGRYSPDNIPTSIVEEIVEKICEINSVGQTGQGTISVSLDEGEEFIDLETYIANNRDFLIAIDNSGTCSVDYPQDLCDLAAVVNPANFPQQCTPSFLAECVGTEDSSCCETPTLIAESLEVEEVTEEATEKIEAIFPQDYTIVQPPQTCNLFQTNSEGGRVRDTAFESEYYYQSGVSGNILTVYARNYNVVNENCSYAEDIVTYNNMNNYIPSYFHNYYGSTTLNGVQTDVLSKASCSSGVIDEYITKGALWFKKDFSQEDKFVIDVTPINQVNDLDKVSQTNVMRMNVFASCNGASVYCETIDVSDGTSIFVDATSSNVLVKDTAGVVHNIGAIPSKKLFIVLDCPIVESQGESNPLTYVVKPVGGCFGILSKPVQYSRVDITYENVTVKKRQTYTSKCYFEVPIVSGDCDVFPYKYGEFGYMESLKEYPDNPQYNSSTLVIENTDIPADIMYDTTTFRKYFEDNYVQTVGGEYVLKGETDFRCQPIRHYKMPDNIVAPFMYEQQIASFSESVIYPLGVTIDEGVINSFLNVAVKNGLISQRERGQIKGYEIVRGDRTANESIVAKGLTTDMRKYQRENKTYSYSNYPFNDLGRDRLNLNDSRTSGIPHPYNGTQNYQWTFDSPDTNKDKVSLPSFMKVEGYMFGRSIGNFEAVREHPEWVILGKKLKRLASTLATAEVVAEAIINIANSAEVFRVQIGFANSANPIGIGMNIAVALVSTVTGVVFNYAKYKYEWLRTFKDLGKAENFAYYYTARGHYNYFLPNEELKDGNTLRYLNVAKNLKRGRFTTTDNLSGERITINHTDREKTVYLSVGSDTTIEYPTQYRTYDNSDLDPNSSSLTFASDNSACTKGLSRDIERNVASMYVALKNYLPEQYGDIGSVRWLTTGYRGDLDNPKTSEDVSVFGGDVFITRNATLRRFPFFVTTAMNQAALTPFEYKFYANIGKEPRYFVNYELNTEDNQGGRALPDIDSDYNMDCLTGESGNYVSEPSKFYLQYNGIPDYLVESTINVWNRYGRKEPWNNFYPNVGDVMEWTQETVNSIRRDIPFFYNNVYSKNVTQTAIDILPSNYNKKEYDCKTDKPSGTMYSLPDNSENAYLDPWLIYRPLDFYEFPAEYGEMLELRGIETAQVLGRFENQAVIFNAVDELQDNGQNPDTQTLGTGGIFARRPRTFANTDLGYAGSQGHQIVSNEFGHFYVDAKRGQIFRVPPGGKGIEEISGVLQGKPSGMKSWFKKHLPFKIREIFPDVDIDNPYNGFGIAMGWDSRYKRVFITKKDYIPNSTAGLCVKDGVIRTEEGSQAIIDQYVGQGYTYDGVIDCQLKFTINRDDAEVVFVDLPRADLTTFKDVSWTISLNLEVGKWASFFDFKPNFYVSHNDFFQTGVNVTKDGTEKGLWSHLLTNKSYQVFYGKAYDWEVEVPVQSKGEDKYLNSVMYSLDVRRYKDNYDYFDNKYLGFEKAYIYNRSNISGNLELELQKSIRQSSKFPKTNGNIQTILQTQQDGEFRFNYFYNRVKNDKQGLPVLLQDSNQIDKSINQQAVSFKGKRSLERLRGETFLINLKSSETQHKKIFKYLQTKSVIYDS